MLTSGSVNEHQEKKSGGRVVSAAMTGKREREKSGQKCNIFRQPAMS